jgi:LysM repeat protein
MRVDSGPDADRRIRSLSRRLWAERAVFLLLLAGLVAFHYGKLGVRRVAVIAIDGRPVAVVASRADANRLLNEIKGASGLPGNVSFSRQVSLYSAPAAGHRVLPDAEAMAILSSKLEPVIQASAILVNGELVAGLPTRNEAVQVLSALLKELSPPGPGVQAAFKEQVRIESREVPVNGFSRSAAAAVERIMKSAAPKGSHEVNPGETGWKIARDARVPLSRLKAANPGVNLDRIRAGDELKIPGELPPLTVIARREIKEELGPGVSRTVRVTYENGAEVSRDIISRERPVSKPRAGRYRRAPQGPAAVP